MSAPSRSGTTHLTVETVLQGAGWEQGWVLWKQIGGNFNTVTERSFGVPDGVNSGQFGIAIDFLGFSPQATGFPVEYRYPSVTTLVPANIAIVKDAPHPENAAAFNDFLLSAQGQEILLDPKIRRLPYALRACMAALQQLSVALEKAAENLGAGKTQTIRRIVIPLMAGGILAGFATAAVELSATIMLVDQDSDAPLSYGIYVFMKSAAGRGPGAEEAGMSNANPVGIQIEDLHLSFGDHQVLKGINLDIAPGELFAFLGSVLRYQVDVSGHSILVDEHHRRGAPPHPAGTQVRPLFDPEEFVALPG